ncbi:hypothetical protein BB560_002816 [Smittium megazygosporum]|uniref:Cytochrome P450 n=1 Tax=Smittium megazygosporum TaxID=133381 RepID=A0A2T9ZDS3_9FUNG|nr:hypothetical protein BB560_002816 [Smittium megazygosporum]
MPFYESGGVYWNFIIIIPLCLIFLNVLKYISKRLIFNQHRKSPSPVLMKNYELAKDSNLLEYIEEFQKAGYVSKFINSKSDFVLGKDNLHLFNGLPENVFSSIIVSKKVFHKSWTSLNHFESGLYNVNLAPILYKNISRLMQKFEYVIHENINKDIELFLQNDHVFIENISEYVSEILIDFAIWLCYGDSSKKDPEFLYSIMLLLGKEASFCEKNIGNVLKFRKSNPERARDYLKDFVLKGKFRKINENIMDENNCLVKFILENQNQLGFSDNVYDISLPDHLYLFVTLLGHSLSNFLIDISLDPRAFRNLEIEQKNLISKYGRVIKTEYLDEMAYLDAAIAESSRLSRDGVSMKEALSDIFLQNGVMIPKGALAKFNILTYTRCPEIFLEEPHSYIPERHFRLGTKLGLPSKYNIMWGLARQCPYAKHCSNFMKLFVATIIRSYEISQGYSENANRHDGYFFENLVQHAKTSLYLKRRDIST